MFLPRHSKPRFTPIQKQANLRRYVHFVDSRLEDKEIMHRTGATSLKHGGSNDRKGSLALHQDMDLRDEI